MLPALQLAFLGLALYLFCLIFIYLIQGSLLFFPTTANHDGHDDPRLLDYRLDRDGVSLRGWLANPQYAGSKLLLYYGGNAEDIFYNLDQFGDIQAASLFVPYRGYGPSTGRPSEAALYADALAVLDDVRQRYQPQQTYLFGRSLGSGVACFVAAAREVDGLVLLTPFDSVENLARRHYPWLPVTLLLKHRFAAIEFLPRITCPVLVVYGGQDQVVPPRHSENLIRNIVGEKEVLFLPRADHGNIDLYPEYWQAVLAFINRRPDGGE
jgi:uncharacterized protein